jgi:hypothetical protein
VFGRRQRDDDGDDRIRAARHLAVNGRTAEIDVAYTHRSKEIDSEKAASTTGPARFVVFVLLPRKQPRLAVFNATRR